MIVMRRGWIAVLLAALMLTPAGIVAAQNDTGENGADEADEAPDGNETEQAEANETDEDDEDDANESDEAGPAFQRRARTHDSSFERDNDTFTGDHVRFELNESLPGIRSYTILDDENATVFDEIALADGEELEWMAVRDRFAMESNDTELMVRDAASYDLAVEANNDTPVTLDVADGVNVSVNETYSEENETLYELAIDDNRTLYLMAEETSFDNGTFTVHDEARLSATFPPEPDERDDDREDRREEARERREEARERRAEIREAGSQWDRDNGTFTGDHVVFDANTSYTGVADYAIVGSIIPVFDEVKLPDSNESDWEAHGQKYELKTEDGEIKILDVPPAVLLVETDDGAQATLTLADGVNATEIAREDDDNETDEAIYRLDLAENRTGWLVGENLTLDNGTFTLTDRAIFRTVPVEADASENKGPGSLPDIARERGGDGDERGPPAHALNNRARMQVEEAIAQGKVSAEVHVGPNTTEPVAVEMGQVRVKDAWIRADGESRAGMTIEAPDDAPGTTVTLSLDESKLGNVSVTEAGDKLAVKFDNQTIPMADDLDDVLNPEDDNGSAEYLLLVGSDKVEILVSVPHFSPHTVEVYETQSSEATTNGAPGFTAVAMVAAVAMAAALAAVRKEN